MDPVGITVACMSIAKLSAQCILSLTIWLGEVKLVDDRIEAFCREMQSLSSILDSLNNALQQPDMQAAAKETKEGAGSSLWDQIVNTVRDCEETMKELQTVLGRLTTASSHRFLRLIRKPVKQFKESLESGEISTLRHRILFYTSGLSLPIQMMNLILQIRKAADDVNDEGIMFQKLDALDVGIKKLNQQLYNFKPSPGSAKTKDTYTKRMESYVRTAGTFVATSSRLASERSSSGTPSRSAISTQPPAKPAWSPPQINLPSITGLFNREMSSSYNSPSQSLSTNAQNFLSSSDEDFDLDLQLTCSYIGNGKAKVLEGEWEGAAGCFRKALHNMKAHPEWDTLVLSKNQLSYLLALACVHTKNYKEAKTLLSPLLSPNLTDRALVYSAAHTVAEMYLLEGKLREAEKMAINAVKGRRKNIGPTATLTYDSLSLVVRIYQSLNDQNEASAWRALLPARNQSPENERAVRQAILEFGTPEEQGASSIPQNHISALAPTAIGGRPKKAVHEKNRRGQLPNQVTKQPVSPRKDGIVLPLPPVDIKALESSIAKHEQRTQPKVPTVDKVETPKRTSLSAYTGIPLPPASFSTAYELGGQKIHASYQIEPYDFMRLPPDRWPRFKLSDRYRGQGNTGPPVVLYRAYLLYLVPFYTAWSLQEIKAASNDSKEDWNFTVPAAVCLNLMTTCTRSFPLDIQYFLHTACLPKQFSSDVIIAIDRINHIKLIRPHPYHVALIRGQNRTSTVFRQAFDHFQAIAPNVVEIEIDSPYIHIFPLVQTHKAGNLNSSSFKPGILSELDLACLGKLPDVVRVSSLQVWPESRGRALTFASIMRDVETVKVLLASPQTQMVSGFHKQILQVSLYEATRYFTRFLLPDINEQVKVLKLLIRAGADPWYKLGIKVKDSTMALAIYHHRFELVSAMRDAWQEFNWPTWKFEGQSERLTTAELNRKMWEERKGQLVQEDPQR